MSEIAQFQDLNFKLTVINALMYDGDALTPRFDVDEFVESHDKRTIDTEEEGYEVIPEVLAWFAALEIPTSLLAGIERLEQEGGDEIWLQIIPFWDGEDDVFNIKSAADAALLPSLKNITLFYDDDDSIFQAFEARGVTAEWL
jgi:hypothetical protein